MASGTEFIIDFEKPRVDIQIVDNQSGEGQLELIFVLDVICAHRDGDVAELENALGS